MCQIEFSHKLAMYLLYVDSHTVWRKTKDYFVKSVQYYFYHIWGDKVEFTEFSVTAKG